MPVWLALLLGTAAVVAGPFIGFFIADVLGELDEWLGRPRG